MRPVTVGTPARAIRSASPVASMTTLAGQKERPALVCTTTPVMRLPSITGSVARQSIIRSTPSLWASSISVMAKMFEE